MITSSCGVWAHSVIRSEAVVGNMRTYQVFDLFDVLPELGDLFDGQVEGGIDEQVGVGNGALDDGRQAPLVDLHDLVDPEDRAVGAARLDHSLHPADGLLVDQVVAAIEAVGVGQDDDLHTRLDLGVVVHHLDERVQRRLGNP